MKTVIETGHFPLNMFLTESARQILKNFIAKKMTSEEFSVNSEQLIKDSIIVVKLKNLKIKRQIIEKKDLQGR